MVIALDVVDSNIELMFSAKKGGMFGVLSKESVGGRGTVELEGKKYPLVGANFSYERETGRIVNFSNYETPGYERARFTIASMSIRTNPELLRVENINPFFKIVNINFESKPTSTASAVLIETMERYNADIAAFNAAQS